MDAKIKEKIVKSQKVLIGTAVKINECMERYARLFLDITFRRFHLL